MMKMENKNWTQIIVLVGCILGGIVTGTIITAHHFGKMGEELSLNLFSVQLPVLQSQVSNSSFERFWCKALTDIRNSNSVS